MRLYALHRSARLSSAGICVCNDSAAGDQIRTAIPLHEESLSPLHLGRCDSRPVRVPACVLCGCVDTRYIRHTAQLCPTSMLLQTNSFL